MPSLEADAAHNHRGIEQRWIDLRVFYLLGVGGYGFTNGGAKVGVVVMLWWCKW